METKAPGVIKLFGEHAVVYGRQSMALAVSRYATCSSEIAGKNSLRLVLRDLDGAAFELKEDELCGMYAKYKESALSAYSKSAGIPTDFIPFVTIASRLMCEHGISALGKRVVVSSEIPVRSGMSSSASCFTAFACLLANGHQLSDSQLIDLARDGERVAHANAGAGSIDVSTAFYGGYVTFSSGSGARRERIASSPGLIIVNTGPKLSTAETVGRVARLRETNPQFADRVFEEINDCAIKGRAALEKGDLNIVGSYMFRNHELLRGLGVSNDRLDRVVSLSKASGALGAKLSGGGGGGIAVVLAKKDEAERLALTFIKNGFDAFIVHPSMTGASGSK
ncbi:Mevalonate kinase [uncultured archaeon]|nr:Mevalonate kinase [uncultured archaeon]